MLARGLLGVPRYPVRLLRSLPSALPNLDQTAVRRASPARGRWPSVTDRLRRTVSAGEGQELERTNLRAPRTSFNGRVSPHRRFVFGQLPLDEVKELKSEHGVTVNDVVVSICAGAVRRWLIEHDELPDEPLVVQVPVSVRSEEQMGTYGNRILMMRAPLFTNERGPPGASAAPSTTR